jgi:hypothetical protein
MRFNTIIPTGRTVALSLGSLVGVLMSMLVLAVGGAHAQFGIAAFDQQITSGPAGGVFTQAGGHPYAITTEINFNAQRIEELTTTNGLEVYDRPEADTKDVITELPPGLFGNPVGLPQCTLAQLTGPVAEGIVELIKLPECPIASQVGTIQVRNTQFREGGSTSFVFPLYNMVPQAKMPATFGFLIAGVPIMLSGNVRNGGDFGVNVGSSGIPIVLGVDGLTTTFWGDPADPSHDAQRCEYAFFGFPSQADPVCPGEPGTAEGPHPDAVSPQAFLTMPVSCTAPAVGLRTTLKIDSWPDPGVFAEKTLFSHLAPGFPAAEGEWGAQIGTTGCDFVPFNPSISVQPTNAQADTPSGLNIEISLPQEGLLNTEGIATSDVKDAVVTLPEGESISPSAATGLGACSLEQIGLHTKDPAACPDSSKLGTVEIDTPLLSSPLEGSIFLGKQNENPFGSLIALYVVAEGHGVILKLPGRVDLDPVTGRIVTTFDDNPQLPFDHLKLNFKAGPRSPLVNPHQCGTYQTTAQFTPWSGNPPAEVTSSFQITSGPEGKPCPGSPQAFAPSFAAGTTNNQAGAFSPLTVTFGRADGEQQLGGVNVRTPPGLLGSLTGVPLCGEPQASQGACGAASEIGGVTVGAGAGANPFYVYSGRVFLTGPYKGGPFGLSIVVPAVAGPFDLGTVVVRGSIVLDPQTTALTVTTDPLPTILDGIPLDLRAVNVHIDRPNFIINPTNCNPLSLAGTLTGGLGSSDAVSNGFQVTNCGRLGFAPKFTVTTPGHTSRLNGAGLTARIVYPSGPEANIAKVKVELPKQLPSRLTTLQKACTDTVFNANPANCPVASQVGQAMAVTPILPEPLTGTAYFVSHGGAAFPDLITVLKGYGVTFDLVGHTFISKAGITSTTFDTVPDVPIASFQLTLHQGPNSALAANGNLCRAKLAMPTKFVAQDGAEIDQSTPVRATGCPKAKKVKKVRHRARRRKGFAGGRKAGGK